MQSSDTIKHPKPVPHCCQGSFKGQNSCVVMFKLCPSDGSISKRQIGQLQRPQKDWILCDLIIVTNVVCSVLNIDMTGVYSVIYMHWHTWQQYWLMNDLLHSPQAYTFSPVYTHQFSFKFFGLWLITHITQVLILPTTYMMYLQSSLINKGLTTHITGKWINLTM